MPEEALTQTELDEVDTSLSGLDHVDEGQVTPAPQKVAAPKSDEWKSALAELTGVVTKAVAPKEATPAPLTPEQIDEYWAVYRPEKQDPEFFRKFLRLNTDMDPGEVEKAVKEFAPMFAAMQKGFTTQAVVGAQRLFEKQLKELREELAPDREFVSEARAERLRARFCKAHPALAVEADDGSLRYGKIIKLCAEELKTQEFESETVYFKALADRAAEILEGAGVPLELGAVQTKKQTGSTPRLPRTSVGGTGGVGGGKGVVLATKGDATAEFLADE